MLCTGVDVPELLLEVPVRGDIGTKKRNKREMLRAYSYAFTAYHKLCQTLRRSLKPFYNAGLDVADDIEDGDASSSPPASEK